MGKWLGGSWCGRASPAARHRPASFPHYVGNFRGRDRTPRAIPGARRFVRERQLGRLSPGGRPPDVRRPDQWSLLPSVQSRSTTTSRSRKPICESRNGRVASVRRRRSTRRSRRRSSVPQVLAPKGMKRDGARRNAARRNSPTQRSTRRTKPRAASSAPSHISSAHGAGSACSRRPIEAPGARACRPGWMAKPPVEALLLPVGAASANHGIGRYTCPWAMVEFGRMPCCSSYRTPSASRIVSFPLRLSRLAARPCGPMPQRRPRAFSTAHGMESTFLQVGIGTAVRKGHCVDADGLPTAQGAGIVGKDDAQRDNMPELRSMRSAARPRRASHEAHLSSGARDLHGGAVVFRNLEGQAP